MAKGGKADAATDAGARAAVIEAAPNAKYSAEALKGVRPVFKVPESVPEMKDVMAAIPKECFEKSFLKSSMYLVISLVVCGALAAGAWYLLPRPTLRPSLVTVLLWAAYAFAQGAAATGLWVIAHECGHDAFCHNAFVQDFIGFVLHSVLLVPYFSWQRSHAVHHSRTNHMDEGETHVPNRVDCPSGKAQLSLYTFLGEDAFAVLNLFNHLVIGWPAYLLTGATGGPVRGMTNHFIPTSDSLFPGQWKAKVLLSDVGVLLTLGGLYAWYRAAGSFLPVMALYGGPYLWVNMWLVLYTWLQHTDVDIPHYEAGEWTWLKGAFATVDRPYPEPFDFLHHKIGSTHVAHHICSKIPHYNARKATEAIKQAFPEHYLYDPTPITSATLRVARKCVAAVREGNRWFYTNAVHEKQ